MTKADLARKYRDEYGMEMPTLKLARIMYNENPLLFKNVEACRTYLRAIEGKARTLEMKLTHPYPERPKNPYKLPESYAVERKAFRLPKECKEILYLPDQHIPYHCIRANTIAIDRGVKDGIDTIVLTGDVLDLHKLSKYQADPKKRDTEQEFEAGQEYLETLRNTFPYAKIYWLKGNHCIRYENFLLQKAQEIFKDKYYQLEERLQLNKYRVDIFSDKQVIKAGNLNVSHGHHILNSKWGTNTPAKTLFDKTGVDFLVGHVHKKHEFIKFNTDGKITKCYTMGCLSEQRPDYNPIVANYMQGFARQTICPSTGEYELENILIKPNNSFYL